MGSMKNTDSGDSGVKDFYTPEEARKFTKKDFDRIRHSSKRLRVPCSSGENNAPLLFRKEK
jgi:hypothetical protein